jgi:YfiH family protein
MTRAPPLRSALLDGLPGVRHGFFTRRGGVSRGIYATLNVGLGSADDSLAVAENRRRVAETFGAPDDHLLTCEQVHSADIFVANGPWRDRPRPRADGVVTMRAGLVCGALSADCAPVLIADSDARVVAAVHAGWRGALNGVIDSAVRAMTAVGADASSLVAAIGPCIGPLSYEVGEDLLERFVTKVAEARRFFAPGARSDKYWFDLPGFVLWRLAEAGVARAEWIGQDTLTDEEAFYSNRRALKRGEADYGRLVSAIMLEG